MSTHQTYKTSIGINEINAVAKTAARSPKFREAWDKSDPYLMYDYAVAMFCPDLTFATFDDGCQWRTVFHANIKEAAREFAHVLAGVK